MKQIKLLLSDVDGVMTDGSLAFGPDGDEIKTFHVRDGLAVHFWQSLGLKFGIVTGRTCRIVQARAKELGIGYVRQGALEKLPHVRDLAKEVGVTLDEIAYIGDDLLDLPVIKAVGLGASVADGVEEVRAAAQFVTQAPGGRGAVREFVEHLLKESGRWEEVLKRYQ
ncbi:3-deoxy-D-manno-octulosonate 8-phosphate phosphatase KdsC [Pirellulimonas nuda]|uniref:3-deoxy-D-manno-octulosonate 8-phosphate phosphatase KdsC n=1 Tax=Pirellulimonas nuda TaxID=2528009 RepID=A0A518DJD7_9BACT|nr:HAD hydrolase family protein [Pirellulimonas nuda]QDU91552.1 3-deoxy-D-manno-octulosonate 8-phosphate phosphatase KdsC [Pirellulimonas nuda]